MCDFIKSNRVTTILIRDMNGSSAIDPEDQALTPRFLTSLHDLEVLEQDSIRIQCRVGGRPPPDIQG